MAQLYFRGGGADAIATTMFREGKLAGPKSLRHMRRVAKLVMEQSIKNSPVDDGELEEAHRLVERYGAGGRLEATIEVGGMVGDVNVDLYAEWIHEGSYQLGKRSIAKAMSTGEDVGPQYLERALIKYEDDFEPLLDDLLEGLMS